MMPWGWTGVASSAQKLLKWWQALGQRRLRFQRPEWLRISCGLAVQLEGVRIRYCTILQISERSSEIGGQNSPPMPSPTHEIKE